MPLYQTRHDRKAEAIVRDWFLSEGWDASITKKVCRWDIEAQNGDKRLLVEVKRRLMQWGQYDTIFIDVDKVNAMLEASTSQDASAVFVVIPNDMKPRFVMLSPANIEKWGTNTTAVQVDRGDPADVADLKYDIPISDFRPLERA